MSIAEQGDARRRERRRELRAADHVADGLPRQAVHQIDIDVSDADHPRGIDRRLDLLERLNAADGLLHMGREILGTEARARDADPAEGRGELRRHTARIEFDRVLGQSREVERPPEPVDDVDNGIGAEDRRRELLERNIVVPNRHPFGIGLAPPIQARQLQSVPDDGVNRIGCERS